MRIVGTRVVRMWGGDPCGRPSFPYTKSLHAFIWREGHPQGPTQRPIVRPCPYSLARAEPRPFSVQSAKFFRILMTGNFYIASVTDLTMSV
jgi:hypothetical protein